MIDLLALGGGVNLYKLHDLKFINTVII